MDSITVSGCFPGTSGPALQESLVDYYAPLDHQCAHFVTIGCDEICGWPSSSAAATLYLPEHRLQLNFVDYSYPVFPSLFSFA